MRSIAAKDNESIVVKTRKWNDTSSVFKKRIQIAPHWLAAAVLTGFLVGIAIPRHYKYDDESIVLVNTQDSCRSLLENDVNFALLVSPGS